MILGSGIAIVGWAVNPLDFLSFTYDEFASHMVRALYRQARRAAVSLLELALRMQPSAIHFTSIPEEKT